MYNIRKINKDYTYIGCNDRKLALFENIHPVPKGVSYNSYLLTDEKTLLLDTADAAVSQQFFENLNAALDGRELDYLIVNHMEPDHCALVAELLHIHPQTTIVTNAKAAQMIRQFFDFNLDRRLQTVSEGDTLCTGKHTLQFVMVPMVHWPEAMFSYDITDRILFSADAFGSFGALDGTLFADEMDFEHEWLDEARRYYTNIVGKYGAQVQSALKKAASLDIRMICPLHGPVWRENLSWFIGKYDKWSRYEPETQGVLIVYGSIYGHTASAAERMATLLAENGVRQLALYDASHTEPGHLLSEAFRYSHIVLASSTYNAGIFTPMEHFLMEMKSHNLQQRSFAVIENGTWAAQSGKAMREMLAQMKQMTVLGESLSLKSSMKTAQEEEMKALAGLITADLKYNMEKK